MAKHSPAELIEAYRQRQGRRSLFTFGDISQALIFLLIMASAIYIMVNGGPALPALVDLKTNTPTFTPSITPTPTQTATITPTPTETPDPENQCNCAATVVVVITATFSPSDTPLPLPSPTETTTSSLYTATTTLTPTETLPPTLSGTSTKTATPTASITPKPTEVLYTVKPGDTLSYVAIRFGVTVEAIQALNNLDTTTIYEGQILQIPKP